MATVFYAWAYPKINLAIMAEIDSSLLSCNQIIKCISMIVIGYLWNNYSKYLIKYADLMLVLSTLLTFIVYIFTIKTMNMTLFYILDTIIFCTISRNCIFIFNRVKAIRYNKEQREKFDNDYQVAAALGTILGSCLSLILNLNVEPLLIVGCIAVAIDNVIYFGEIKRKGIYYN